MKRIILDTNFLMIPGSLGVDIFSEIARIADFQYKLFVVDKSIAELKRLSKEAKGKHKRAARLGLAFAERASVLETEGECDADTAILALAKPGIDIVATQDAELKRKLKANGVCLLVLRKKKYLNMVET